MAVVNADPNSREVLGDFTNKETEQLDELDNLTVEYVKNVLGVEVDYSDDDMNDLVHSILDLVVEWGVQKKGVIEQNVYPFRTE